MERGKRVKILSIFYLISGFVAVLNGIINFFHYEYLRMFERGYYTGIITHTFGSPFYHFLIGTLIFLSFYFLIKEKNFVKIITIICIFGAFISITQALPYLEFGRPIGFFYMLVFTIYINTLILTWIWKGIEKDKNGLGNVKSIFDEP